MKATELRIGNIIFANWLNQGVEVEEITYMDSDSSIKKELGKYAINEISQDEYRPIILTEEWMLQFGFEMEEYEEKENNRFTHPDNTDFDLVFFKSPNDYWCAYNLAISSTDKQLNPEPQILPICSPFKYVHQLQNIYFSLTGTELQLITE